MSLMELKNVNMIFPSGKKENVIGAVVDANLTIDEGEIIAVIGESGSGKTTLGKVIVGVHKPTSGQILYKGKDVTKLTGANYKDYRLGVQMVHQDSFAALNPNKTIFQSLSIPLYEHKIVKGSKDAAQMLMEYLVEVGLTPPEQFLEKYPHQLSGGQRQRILLARALSMKPKLIVADEPVSMVDVSLRISLLDLMTRMNQKYKISFIYITHDLGTARYIASHGRIVVMYLGRQVEIGQIQETIENPKHPYTYALVSAVPEADPDRRSNFADSLPLKSLDMPSLLNLPTGCKFNPRCPNADKLCEMEEPRLLEYSEEDLKEKGKVKCHHTKEILRARSKSSFMD
ncbi:ABC transporter ATP-binding protein [Candidatus Epulonipiscium viviparus]|uniref:ABC transporter ATP-binding protein n=1 Tax=Candidatus Epulonipiscium viviparus TaxID=420336 RepID=UPI000494E097|nr:ABC transporter ATP-binding protein [Candidatus Epulopiscium viviparus]